MDFCVNTILENKRCEVIFVEYNTKTRMGIGMCLLMMLLILVTVLAGVYYSAYEENVAVNGTDPDDDAIYVNAGVKDTTESTTTSTTTTETTTSATTSATTTKAENIGTTATTSAVETEKRALYYVTVSGGDIVLLDEYGEFMQTVYEDAVFLPQEDLAMLRAGIELYSKTELASFLDDFS